MKRKCRLLVLHRAHRYSGEFQRIEAVMTAFEACAAVEMTELLLRSIRSFEFSLQFQRPASGHARVILPILLPEGKLPVFRPVNRKLERWAAQWVSARLEPEVILGETHESWPLVKAAAAGSPRAVVMMDLHGAVAEEVAYARPPGNETEDKIRAIDAAERELMRRSRIVLCQSPAMVEYLKKKHPETPPSLHVFPCGVDTARFCLRDNRREAMRARLGYAPADLVFVYSGGLSKWQLIDDTLEIFAQFRERAAGVAAKALILTHRDAGIVAEKMRALRLPEESVRIVRASHDEVPEYLNACDFGMLLREDSVVNRVASPTKLGEYLACGLPVVVYSVARAWEACRRDPECFVMPEQDDIAHMVETLEASAPRLAANRDAQRKRCAALAETCLSAAIGNRVVRENVIPEIEELVSLDLKG